MSGILNSIIGSFRADTSHPKTLYLSILSQNLELFPHFCDRFEQIDLTIFPPDSPTRTQLSVGIGIPLPGIDEGVTLGWSMKIQYFLPETADQLKWIYFQDVFQDYTPTNYNVTQWHRFPHFPHVRKKREVIMDDLTGQKVEWYDQEAKVFGTTDLKAEPKEENDEYENEPFEDEVEEDPEQDPSAKYQEVPNNFQKSDQVPPSSRWDTYDGFSRILNNKQLGGKDCILRTICEATQVEFSQESGLLGEIMHILLTPSTTSDAIYNYSHYDYIKAEELGKKGAPCKEVFKDCQSSLLDFFTHIYDTKYYTFLEFNGLLIQDLYRILSMVFQKFLKDIRSGSPNIIN